jgi:hypothetical protein
VNIVIDSSAERTVGFIAVPGIFSELLAGDHEAALSRLGSRRGIPRHFKQRQIPAETGGEKPPPSSET